ncbi:MAG: hypothetical protein LBR84_01890 [Tannerella sp.]|jgi:hypothetical protein|nr:hypothetical protein [Tannerella sp.]
MKRLSVLFIAGIVAVACLAGCGGKDPVDNSLEQIEKAIQKVEKNKKSMTEEDWKAFSKEVEEPCRILDQALKDKEVGTMKKLKISATMLKFAAIAGEAGLNTAVEKLGEKVKEATDKVKDEAEKAQE